ncbi:MAG: phosphoribosyltransferase family protein [Roseovarius pacificus]|nr:phosphoribosyltransferase family protein [Roseovarius pacificus]
MTIYQDREDAARQVLEALPPLMDDDIVVLALPRGGVPIGAVIARALNAPLDLLLVRKVGAPRNPELAIGAVTGPGNDGLVVNESVAQLYGLTREDVARLAEPELDELERRRQAYLGQRPKVPVRGKTVILVDDGIATGTTVRSALVALRQQGPKRIILAVPVACADVLADSGKSGRPHCLPGTPFAFRSRGRGVSGVRSGCRFHGHRSYAAGSCDLIV